MTLVVAVERRDASVQAGSPNAPAPHSSEDGEESVLLTVPRPPACKKKQMIPSIQVFKEIDQRIIFEVRLSSPLLLTRFTCMPRVTLCSPFLSPSLPLCLSSSIHVHR